MSIKSTQYIPRTQAIERLQLIAHYLKEKDYRRITQHSFEPHCSVKEFVEAGLEFFPAELDKWTNEMLGDKMDKPFYRYSMFENYIVQDDGVEE